MPCHMPTFTFSQIDETSLITTLHAHLENAREIIATVSQLEHPTWDTFIRPMEQSDDAITQFWSPVSHLHSVKNTKALREVYEQGNVLLTQYYTEVAQNQALFNTYKALQASTEAATYNQAQRQTLDHAIRDFTLAGVGLDADKKRRYQEISERLTALSTQFENNLMDASDHWYFHTDHVADLAGLPEHTLAAAQKKAKKNQQSGYRLGIDIPTYLAVSTYAESQALRQTFYTAYCTRASDQGPHAGKWDNSAIMQELLALKTEKAHLLDFATYADYSCASKMAESPAEIEGFLVDLAKHAKPLAQQELTELRAFAKETLGLAELHPWDLAFASEKYRQHHFAVSEEALRPYFPLDKVMHGMFWVVEQLYGITFTQRDDKDTWDPEVRYFDVYKDGQHIAGFYLDPFAREQKRGGAWMDDLCGRYYRADGTLQLPVATLTCNFTPASDSMPSCLTHDEIITLFHEFGHGLHHMLTQMDVLDVSGISGVPWDAVELPSQFMENYAWQWPVIEKISAHYQTGETLPRDDFDRLLNTKTFHAGMQCVRQLEFALFDIRLHQHNAAKHTVDIQQVLNNTRQEVAVVNAPEFNRFQHGFSHIFAGGYAAGYYSYKWAEVLAADAFARFEEDGIFNDQTGQDFLHHILSRGGSEAPMDLFVRFRGRKPNISALLKEMGITQ